MNTRLYLDRVGDAVADDPLPIATTEVELLRLLNSHQSGIIRGNSLCRWASEYARGRGIEIVNLPSPSEQLRGCFPGLSDTQIRQLSERLGKKLGSGQEISAVRVAHWLWGDEWWLEQPGPEHTAFWLLWWLEHQPTESEIAILTYIGDQFTRRCHTPHAKAYSVDDQATALQHIKTWLGFEGASQWDEFPIPFSDKLTEIIEGEINNQILEVQGEVISSLPKGIDKRVLQIAAQQSAIYYASRPRDLTYEAFRQLEPYLEGQRRSELEKLLPPTLPGPIPTDPSEYGKWFISEYLPYRIRIREEDISEALKIGRLFAVQYLHAYKENVHSDSTFRRTLSWEKAGQIYRNPGTMTLMIVLDGLSYLDMQYLWTEIQRLDDTKRLAVISEEVVFAPLPTITKWAKPALLGGLPPGRAVADPNCANMGYTQEPDILRELTSGSQEKVVVWRDLEPDFTYHKSKGFSEAIDKAKGALSGFAMRLIRVIKEVPDSISLKVIVTTDHGRLYGESSRSHPLPPDTTSHQRTALGHMALKDSLCFDGDQNIAYLHKEAFRLPEDCAVVVTEGSFVTQDGKRGQDVFPHGGVFPEEVLIPWWVLGRDINLAPLYAELPGTSTVPILTPQGKRSKEVESGYTLEASLGPSPDGKSLIVVLQLKGQSGLGFGQPIRVQLDCKAADGSRALLVYPASPSGELIFPDNGVITAMLQPSGPLEQAWELVVRHEPNLAGEQRIVWEASPSSRKPGKEQVWPQGLSEPPKDCWEVVRHILKVRQISQPDLETYLKQQNLPRSVNRALQGYLDELAQNGKPAILRDMTVSPPVIRVVEENLR